MKKEDIEIIASECALKLWQEIPGYKLIAIGCKEFAKLTGDTIADVIGLSGMTETELIDCIQMYFEISRDEAKKVIKELGETYYALKNVGGK